MYTCAHCKGKFKNQPLIGPNNKKYCSRKCIPDSIMDEPYSFEYFNLIESINDIKSRISDIKDIDDRFHLENEVNYLNTSYIIDMAGDDEGLFYKRQIHIELKTFDKLYDEIHNIFMERKVQPKRTIIIYWDELFNIVGNEIYNMILKCFQEKMKGVTYETLNFLHADPATGNEFRYNTDKLYIRNLRQAQNIEKIYSEIFNQFRSKLTNKQLNSLSDNNNCISVDNLAYCVVCKDWESFDDFFFDEKLNVYRCGIWNDCSKYEDYYADEY